MFLKKIKDDESGFVHTLEAIIGVFLIIGTIVFITSGMPNVAQKTGEHSKIQLVNIGRDAIDLLAITPVYEICPDCLKGVVEREYLLEADKTFVVAGKTVNFTVEYLNGTPVNKPLKLDKMVIGTKNIISSMTINGSAAWSFSSSDAGEYSFIAYDSFGKSNLVTISVGYYYLNSSVEGVAAGQLVTGIVNGSNGGVPNLTIRIWGYPGGSLVITNASATSTTTGGNFSFNWSETSSGTYYIQAVNKTNNTLFSNKHRILFADKSGFLGIIDSAEDTIYETQTTQIILNSSKNNLAPLSQAIINQVGYGCPGSNESVVNLTFDPADLNQRTVNFTAYVAGDYYIFWGNVGGKCSDGSNDNANSVKTNSIIIHVLPLKLEGNALDMCIDKRALNKYVSIYTSPNVNYNMYLIGSKGDRFTRCTQFEDGEFINGYPTEDAITVNKLVHVKYGDINNILEFRMVMWYK